MIDHYLHKTHQYQETIKRIDRLIQLRECVVVLFPYLSDRAYVAQQWISLPSTNLLKLNILIEEATSRDAEEFESFINRKILTSFGVSIDDVVKQDNIIVLVISEGENWIKEDYKAILARINQLLIKYPHNVQCLLAMEHDPKSLISKQAAQNRMFQNQLIYGLYKEADIKTYIKYLAEKWQLDISSKMQNEIISSCSGSYWLIENALKELRDYDSWSVNSRIFCAKLAELVREFSKEEITILNALTKPDTDPDRIYIRYRLEELGWIDNKAVTVDAIVPYIQKTVTKRLLISQKDEELFLGELPLSKTFSPSEYSTLKLLYSYKNKPVSRDTIGQVLWAVPSGKNTQWAIDQIIKRLRARLSKLGLPDTLIFAVRGIGYEYRSEPILLSNFLTQEVLPIAVENHVNSNSVLQFIDKVSESIYLSVPEAMWHQPNITPITMGALVAQMVEYLNISKYAQLNSKLKQLAHEQKIDSYPLPLRNAISNFAQNDICWDLYLHWPDINMNNILQIAQEHVPNKIGAYNIQMTSMIDHDKKTGKLVIKLENELNETIFSVNLTQVIHDRANFDYKRHKRVGGLSEYIQYPIQFDDNKQLVVAPNRRKSNILDPKRPSILQCDPKDRKLEFYLREIRKRISWLVSVDQIPQKQELAYILAPKDQLELKDIARQIGDIYNELDLNMQTTIQTEVLAIFGYNTQLAQVIFDQLKLSPRNSTHPFWDTYKYLKIVESEK
ncbi:MAG: helix-turn-helix domain-containing protein [bacterium]